jgi:hypothetical protein
MNARCRDLLSLIRLILLGRFRSKASLEAEILALRHQLNVLRRTSRLLVWDRAAYSGRHHDRGAGNSYPVASGRLSLLLALEIASACRQAQRPARNSATDPRRQESLPVQRAVSKQTGVNNSLSR